MISDSIISARFALTIATSTVCQNTFMINYYQASLMRMLLKSTKYHPRLHFTPRWILRDMHSNHATQKINGIHFALTFFFPFFFPFFWGERKPT